MLALAQDRPQLIGEALGAFLTSLPHAPPIPLLLLATNEALAAVVGPWLIAFLGSQPAIGARVSDSCTMALTSVLGDLSITQVKQGLTWLAAHSVPGPAYQV